MSRPTVYLAARYSRHAEMRRRREWFTARGIHVTSRWIDQHGSNVLESFVASQLNTDPQGCAKYAQVDLDDMIAADWLVSFTNEGGGGKGGRHVEFGWALAQGKKLTLIGPREHVFHTLPQVEVFLTWEAFTAAYGWWPSLTTTHDRATGRSPQPTGDDAPPARAAGPPAVPSPVAGGSVPTSGGGRRPERLGEGEAAAPPERPAERGGRA